MFHVLAIVSNAAMNIEVHISFGSCFAPDICPGVGLQGLMVAFLNVNNPEVSLQFIPVFLKISDCW